VSFKGPKSLQKLVHLQPRSQGPFSSKVSRYIIRPIHPVASYTEYVM